MDQQLKKQVQTYWNKASCGTEHTNQEKFSDNYFEQIEDHRYTIEPEIFSFAQFTRFSGKKILEVGIGAGTDFTQWVRAGALAHGIDLTQAALDNAKKRLSLQNLKAADLQVADAEKLPYHDNSFDLVYSWGVIHHSPDTIKCLEEIIRVAKPDGTIKLMIYHRRALFVLYRWLLEGLLKARPFRSFTWILHHHQESKGTKAYTFKEIRTILAQYPVTIKSIKAPATNHDLLYYKSKPFRWLATVCASLMGWNHCGFFMMIELEKKG